MRFYPSISVVVCVVAAGLGAVGCSPSGSSSSAAGSATAGSGSPTPSSAAAGSSATAQAGTGTSTLVPSPQTQAAGGVSKCLPANLKFALGGKRQTAQDQWTQVVDMTNQASSACTMDGFPGVDLIGDTKGQPNLDWTLEHSSANGAKVTLQPGATAHFDLVYLSGDLASGGGSENVISVRRMVITTPGFDNQSDAAVQGSLDWFQDVVLQDGATHPGTYVMTVASGS